jgi:aspartyl-tRNA synthetase
VTPDPAAPSDAPMRTDYCGDLRADDIDRQVAVCGWVARRREHGEHLAFIDVRDRTGIVQCVVDGAHDLRSEYVVRVTGPVRRRPDGTVNPGLPTGEVEIGPAQVEILSEAEPPPFQIDERVDVDETVRLRYRYLDLRSERMQRNLRVRATVNSALRRSMEAQGFTEIETPMLIASTPEGARDFVVPSRLSPGRFYALPQSPQLFKQLCMVGGIDRYYQIARCLRDEDLRADRQFEFMQLDAEASFVSQAEVLAFIAEAVAEAAESVTGERPAEVPVMTWQEAQERFGSDKPDVRFAMELTELSEVFAQTGFNAFKASCVKAIRVPGAGDLGRNRLDGLTDQAKRWGAKGLVWMRVEPADGGGLTLNSPVAKFLSDEEQAGIIAALEAEAGDLVLIVADQRPMVNHVLGLLRLELGRPPVNQGGFHFLWVVDFPLFESIDDQGRPVSAHHPFTMPHTEDWALLESSDPADLLAIRSQAYDLVLNGWELGSGSVRIHRSDIQSRIFGLLGISPEEAQAKFGFLLDAFRYGAPPHAGFAFGIDRLVALLAGEENIREVIAFPKTQSGADPLTSAPSQIDPAQLAELGLRVLPRAT